MPPPPYDYSPRRHRYQTPDGRTLHRREVKGAVDKLIREIKAKAKTYGERVEAGTLTPAEFELEMRALLKAGHIIAASVGRGGRVRMTQSDWGWVGAKIKWQFGYLRKFTDKVIKGRIDKPVTSTRAQKYASSIYITFYQTIARDHQKDPNIKRARRILNAKESCPECVELAAQGWTPVDELPLLGEATSCGDFCKCRIEFEDEQGGTANAD